MLPEYATFGNWRKIKKKLFRRNDTGSQYAVPANKLQTGNCTSGDVDEVFAAGSIDFDVALTKMMFVPTKRKSSMFVVLEPHQCFPVTPSLLTQAQCHAASEVCQKQEQISQPSADMICGRPSSCRACQAPTVK